MPIAASSVHAGKWAVHHGPDPALPEAQMRGVGRRFVYIIRSQADPERHYVGVASDVDERLEWHNAGPTGFTTAHRPWFVVVTIEFATEREAMRFEKYLKSGSGRAFTKRHFAPGIET